MKVQGAKALARKLARMPDVARKDISDAIAKGATEIVTFQKAAVPVQSGRLRDSIGWQWGGRGLFGQLRGDARLSAVIMAGGATTTKEVRSGSGVDYDYALGQEFGTADTSAQPFFFPGYRLGKRRARSRITRAANKAAKKVAAGG